MKLSTNNKTLRAAALALLFLLIALSFKAKAQYRKHQRRQSKSYGVEVSMNSPHFVLHSNISQLDGLKTSCTGFNVGGVVTNGFSKIKVTAGMSTSNGNMPYAVDLIRGGASWNVYLLRIGGKKKVHALEPYLTLGASLMRMKYYGTYLDPNTASNYSTDNLPYLGKSDYLSVGVGMGVEYQLENENLKFIHLFVQTGYGLFSKSLASDRPFAQTINSGRLSYSMGINFQISR
ncbi:MAG TPA: hypothetical protein VL728_16340 [Cyclobacteriaceae bacterium]|jgi:hypothetical protein|nr:hypothetical protein [Cyclobacteriaceae bacterium]